MFILVFNSYKQSRELNANIILYPNTFPLRMVVRFFSKNIKNAKHVTTLLHIFIVGQSFLLTSGTTIDKSPGDVYIIK